MNYGVSKAQWVIRVAFERVLKRMFHHIIHRASYHFGLMMDYNNLDRMTASPEGTS